MLRTLRAISYVVALLFALAGCQALTGETMGEHIDDCLSASGERRWT
jgi:hypothetical protein